MFADCEQEIKAFSSEAALLRRRFLIRHIMLVVVGIVGFCTTAVLLRWPLSLLTLPSLKLSGLGFALGAPAWFVSTVAVLATLVMLRAFWRAFKLGFSTANDIASKLSL